MEVIIHKAHVGRKLLGASHSLLFSIHKSGNVTSQRGSRNLKLKLLRLLTVPNGSTKAVYFR